METVSALWLWPSPLLGLWQKFWTLEHSSWANSPPVKWFEVKVDPFYPYGALILHLHEMVCFHNLYQPVSWRSDVQVHPFPGERKSTVLLLLPSTAFLMRPSLEQVSCLLHCRACEHWRRFLWVSPVAAVRLCIAWSPESGATQSAVSSRLLLVQPVDG